MTLMQKGYLAGIKNEATSIYQADLMYPYSVGPNASKSYVKGFKAGAKKVAKSLDKLAR